MNVELERAKYLTAAVLVHLDQLMDDAFSVRSILGFLNYQPDPFGEDQNLSSLEEMRRIFETLEELSYIYGYHDRYSEPRYEFTEKGSVKVSEESGNKDSLIHRYKKFGISWLAEVLEGISSSGSSSEQGTNLRVKRTLKYPTIDDVPDFDSLGDFDELTEARRLGDIGVPASDRYVELNHNNPEYKDAINTLDKVIQEFGEDHHLDNELGREKPALMRALEGGRELLNDTRVRVHAVLTLVIAPLRIIAAKYDESIVAGTIGALATAAIAAIAKLIGLA